MKLLLDQGLPHSAASLIDSRGHSAVHVADLGMSTAIDSDILQFARDNDQVIITLDADFHALLALSGALQPSVIRLRVEGLTARPLTDLVINIVNRYGDELKNGAVVSADGIAIRIRRLPLVAVRLADS